SPLADAEIITTVANSLKELGFQNFKILINDRRLFEDISPDATRIIDKLKKVGRDKVIKDLAEAGLSSDTLEKFENNKPTENLQQIFSYLEKSGVNYEFTPTLARGLDYYTGMIFEVEIEDYSVGSIAGGGRYDNLIGLFANNSIPAVGVSYGFDRIIEAMDQLDLFPADLATTKVLVTVFSKELEQKSIELSSALRSKVNCELWLNPDTKLDKQLKYADQKDIPFAIIIGPEETKEDKVVLKNLKERTQETLSLDEAIFRIKQ
ncbi:ATP phosphoribosyltransferase regulatory subunit, partial [Candidatus Daviesbacteria bacterium]|nr:ATP phosphoribosyltransferase regulatory subunit [Candidatus Daviesbacteria bacterium]